MAVGNRLALRVGVVLACAALVSGCSLQQREPESTGSASAAEAEPAFSIDQIDWREVEWSLSHYGQMIPVDDLLLTDGMTVIETVTYAIVFEEIVYGDADGDGDLDAIVPVAAVSSDGVELNRAWYLWADRDGEAVQARVPAALDHCDIVVDSVTAVDGGFEIREFHLRSGEKSYIPCGDPGSDERIRTVGVSADGMDGRLWPVQIAPFVSFGGVCPISTSFHGDTAQTEHFPVPDSEAIPLAGGQVNTWPVEEWQIFRDGYPGWQLVGVNVDGDSGCAWRQV